MALGAVALGASTFGFFLLTVGVAAASAYEASTLISRTQYSMVTKFLVYYFIILYGTFFAYHGMIIKSHEFVTFLFSVVWTTDIAALLIGRLSKTLTSNFDSSKNSNWNPIQWISKHKTIAGCVGGWTCGTIIGCIVLQHQPNHFDMETNNIQTSLTLSALTSFAAVMGDLIESAFKRYCNVKDSNVFVNIPGHGGVLDRVDSILLAAPVCAMYIQHHLGL